MKRKRLLVDVWSANMKRCLGVGEIIGHEKVSVLGVSARTPVIKLRSGRKLRGFECWWHKMVEVK